MKLSRIFACLAVIMSFGLSMAEEGLSSDKRPIDESVVKKEQDRIAKDEALIKEKYKNTIRTSSGLRFITLKEGNGGTPAKGAIVEAHYTGRLLDGTKFDSSVDRGHPFTFVVGKGEVIKGWDEAFLSMKKGEKRILIIPPGLAYGEKGMGSIPPDATLVFEVELIDFLK